jgi:hypothetical protein
MDWVKVTEHSELHVVGHKLSKIESTVSYFVKCSEWLECLCVVKDMNWANKWQSTVSCRRTTFERNRESIMSYFTKMQWMTWVHVCSEGHELSEKWQSTMSCRRTTFERIWESTVSHFIKCIEWSEGFCVMKDTNWAKVIGRTGSASVAIWVLHASVHGLLSSKIGMCNQWMN